MGRRKRKKAIGKMTFIYISMILSLSLMGVGYAAWNDQLIINASISTGDIKLAIDTIQGRIYGDNGDYLDIAVGDNSMVINGEVYPESSNYLDINILDKGSVPIILKSIDEPISDVNVSSLDNNSYYGFRTFNSYSILGQDEIRESFKLNINPSQDLDENSYNIQTLSIGTMDVYENNEIERLSNEINDLKKSIDQYKNINSKYHFEYNLLFEQAL